MNVGTSGNNGTNGSTPHLRLQMLSNPLYLSGARELVSSVAKRLGFPDTACGQIALAVDEALCNVMRHGYDRREDAPIWISVWPFTDEHGDALRIVIEDEAKQVDPAAIKSRDLEQIRPGGLGVHIIKEVMDDAVYEKRDAVGMRLTLVKRKAPKPTPAPTATSAPAPNASGNSDV
ncbi:MAG: ATP-binding protein [Planctomycetota bacterium]|nr:ATP-binding protein [Planctomycetota bacterium]